MAPLSVTEPGWSTSSPMDGSSQSVCFWGLLRWIYRAKVIHLQYDREEIISVWKCARCNIRLHRWLIDWEAHFFMTWCLGSVVRSIDWLNMYEYHSSSLFSCPGNKIQKQSSPHPHSTMDPHLIILQMSETGVPLPPHLTPVSCDVLQRLSEVMLAQNVAQSVPVVRSDIYEIRAVDEHEKGHFFRGTLCYIRSLTPKSAAACFPVSQSINQSIDGLPNLFSLWIRVIRNFQKTTRNSQFIFFE